MTGAHRVQFQFLVAKHETPVSSDASGILFRATELALDPIAGTLAYVRDLGSILCSRCWVGLERLHVEIIEQAAAI
jgi:hypothetical protein